MNGPLPPADGDALLCALVLAPRTFARNRFYSLYTEPWARRTRARAAQLRAIVRELSAHVPHSILHEIVPLEDSGTVVRYGVPDLHFQRTAILGPLELAIVRFALSRRPRTPPDPHAAALKLTEEDRRRVEGALARLGEKLGIPLLPPPPDTDSPSPEAPLASVPPPPNGDS
jgi:hypothetical protein